MVFRPRTRSVQKYIRALDVRTRASFIPIRKPLVGMLVAWANASRRARVPVRLLVTVDVWIILLKKVLVIRLATDAVVLPVVP